MMRQLRNSFQPQNQGERKMSQVYVIQGNKITDEELDKRLDQEGIHGELAAFIKKGVDNEHITIIEIKEGRNKYQNERRRAKRENDPNYRKQHNEYTKEYAKRKRREFNEMADKVKNLP
jgi:hypothetical protein